MNREWNKLYKEAKSKLNTKELSPFIKIATSSCVIESNNKYYTGVNINEKSAEESALILMVNDGNNVVKKMLVINELEEIIPPRLDDLLNLLSLSKENMDTNIMVEDNKIITLKELLPDYYGTYRL